MSGPVENFWPQPQVVQYFEGSVIYLPAIDVVVNVWDSHENAPTVSDIAQRRKPLD
jgi:hypothetical protein